MTLHLIVLLLATWRITNLFVDGDEGGPWQSLHWLRWKLGVRYDKQTQQPFGSNIISRAMSCFWCWSIWVGIAITIPYMFWPKPTALVLLPFALSAGALMIKRYMKA